MPEQTKIQRNPNGFDEYVRRLRSICDMHKVSFGSPGDLPGFMQSLTENSHFAMDFWALTGTVSSGRPGDLSSEQAVAAIIDGVAGGAIPEPDREQKGIVDDLSRLLAGVDIYNPEAQSADSGKRVGGRGPFSPPPDRVPSSGAAGGGSDEPVSLGPASSSQMDEIRSRFERAQRAAKEPAGKPAEPSRAVFEPNASRSEPNASRSGDSFASEQDDPSPLIRQEGYPRRIGHYVIAGFVVLALVAAGGIFATRERWNELPQGPSGGESSVSLQPPQSMAAPPAPNAVSGNNAPEQTVATPVPPQAAATKPDPNTLARVLASRAAATQTAVGEDLSPAIQTTAVKVAPAVMEANLVTSRVPVYPEIAKIKHVQGSVVMQAVISKDGTVDRVRVVEGDALLRGPAMEAVRKWRYRPYLVNGKPVEVQTTITVDYELDE